MISLEKWSILTPLQKLPKNVGDLDKLILAKVFKTQSGHTERYIGSYSKIRAKTSQFDTDLRG